MAFPWTFTLMEGLELIENHSDIAVGYELTQDEEMPRYEDMLRIFIDRWQVVENLMWQLATERSIDDGVGDQLDALGDILEEPRGSKTDAEYRLFLRARILVLRSHGRMPNIIEIMTLLGVFSGAQINQYSTPYNYPLSGRHASVHISIVETTYALGVLIGEIIAEARGAGVYFHWLWTPEEDDDAFSWSKLLDADELDADRGFENIAATSGGRLSYGEVL